MERKAWKGKAWKIYGKKKHGKYMKKGGKFKDGSALGKRGGGISDSMGLEIGQYASFLCGGDYRPCGAGGFVLWRGACFNTAVYSFYYFCI
jgi:hypothetical protein